MTTSSAIEGFLNHFIEKYFDYDIVKDIRYSSTLDFNRLPETVINEKLNSNPDNTIPNSWAFVLWSRDAISTVNTATKITEVYNNLINRFFIYKTAEVKVNFKIIINNLDYSEALEETILCRGETGSSFTWDFGDELGKFNLSYSDFAFSDRDDLDNNTFGPLSSLRYSATLRFPILDYNSVVTLEKNRQWAELEKRIHDEVIRRLMALLGITSLDDLDLNSKDIALKYNEILKSLTDEDFDNLLHGLILIRKINYDQYRFKSLEKMVRIWSDPVDRIVHKKVITV